MKGLFYKDAVTILNSYRKNFLYVLALYTAMTVALDMAFLQYAMVFVLGTYILSSLSFDDYSHWDRYARTLPLPAGQVVACKYLLGLLFMGGGMALALLMLTAVDLIKGRGLTLLGENLCGCLVSLVIVLLYFAVCYPLSYKYSDPSKVRSMVMMAGAVLAFGGYYLVRWFGPWGTELEASLLAVSDAQAMGFLALVCAVSLALYFLSWGISTAIYKKKEF